MLRLTGFVAAAAIAVLISANSAIAVSGAQKPTTVCQKGGYLDLFPQDGTGTLTSPSSMFKKQTDCMQWIRDGGAVGKLRVELIPGPSIAGYPGTWMALWFTISGAAATGGCFFDPSLPYALSYARVGYSGGACIGPFVDDQRFESEESLCRTPDESFEYNVLLATSSGGVVGRTVARTCT